MATKKKATKKKALKKKPSVTAKKKAVKKSVAASAAKRSTKAVKKVAASKSPQKTNQKKKRSLSPSSSKTSIQSSIKKSSPKPAQDRSVSSPAFATKRSQRSGEQSGDLQGLVRNEGADSESVDELLEEGNAFEAGAVIGVEDADDSEGSEVHTHEVPEDDVPQEYLDED